jgi:hypothetical protein
VITSQPDVILRLDFIPMVIESIHRRDAPMHTGHSAFHLAS